jgi:chromosome segregation ATPase
MTTKYTDAEALQIALTILDEEGSLTVRRLAAEVAGDTARISRIVREAHATRAAAPPPADGGSADLDMPAQIRSAMSSLDRAISGALLRTISEEATRSRAAEEALRREHVSALEAARHDLVVAQTQMAELEEIVAETSAQRDQAWGRAGRIDELERTLDAERRSHGEAMHGLRSDLEIAREAERRGVEAAHTHEVAATRALTEVDHLRRTLAEERTERQIMDQRIATLQDARDAEAQEARTLRRRVDELTTRLDAQIGVTERLEALLGTRLKDRPRNGGKRAGTAATDRKGTTSA